MIQCYTNELFLHRPCFFLDFCLQGLSISLTLADRGPALGPCSSFLASFVEQRVARGVKILDLHLVVVHTHGR